MTLSSHRVKVYELIFGLENVFDTSMSFEGVDNLGAKNGTIPKLLQLFIIKF